MGIENNITCSFCRKERGSSNHIFWLCTYVRSFWERFQIVVNAGCSNATSVALHENIVLFGHNIHFKSDITFDLIIFQAKFFSYECKISKTIPQFHLFNRYLQTNFGLYKYNAKLKMSHSHVQAEVTRLHLGCSSYTDLHVQPRSHQIILTHQKFTIDKTY